MTAPLCALPLLQAFPSAAPFRIDQVTAAPQAMTLIFVVQGLLAAAMSWAAVAGRTRLWRWLTAAFLLLVLLFFTLASWGNSDTTKLSHFLTFHPIPIELEPLWTLIAPVVVRLPYRMAFFHGLVVSGYAAAAILLARIWGARAWAGWWALLILCSPMLRGFLQNAHSRQALAVLLLLPLFLHMARLVRIGRIPLGVGVLVSAITHGTFAFNLTISLAPLLLRLSELSRGWLRHGLDWRSPSWRRKLPLLLLMVAAAVLLLWSAPMALQRLRHYSQEGYFNTYPIRPVVVRLQWSLALGVLLGCLQRRREIMTLICCPLTHLLLLFGLAYLGIQASISHLWLPQVTSRLSDAVAFFLLVTCLAWSQRHRVTWCLLPALYVTLQYWLEGRLLPSAHLSCGLNDEFLCIPDRWPWQVRY